MHGAVLDDDEADGHVARHTRDEHDHVYDGHRHQLLQGNLRQKSSFVRSVFGRSG